MSNFLITVQKWVRVAETTWNNKVFGSGTAKGCTVQFDSRSFSKDTKALKTELSDWPTEADWLMENSTEVHTHCWPFNGLWACEANLRSKRLNSASWLKIKMVTFELLPSFSMLQQWTISRSDSDVQLRVGFIWQLAITA